MWCLAARSVKQLDSSKHLHVTSLGRQIYNKKTATEQMRTLKYAGVRGFSGMKCDDTKGDLYRV